MVQRERPEEISQPDLNEEANAAAQRLLESAVPSRQAEATTQTSFDMGKLRALGANVGFGSFDSGSTEISRIPVGLGQFSDSQMSTRIAPELTGPPQSYVFASKQNYYQVRQHRLAEQELDG